jgi:L-ascorbate 6-phosphate lactonase
VKSLATRIRETQVEPGSLAIFWIAQAGFVYKTPRGQIIYVDPYLTESVGRLLKDVMYGFKRLTQTLIEPEEVEADLVVITHEHQDHFDVDTIPILARDTSIRFVGGPDCAPLFAEAGAPTDRVRIFHQGETIQYDGFTVTGVYADHGELAPNALGVLLQFGDIKVWQVGDSAYRPDRWQNMFGLGIDVLIPPINGAFGNLNGVEAAKLAADCAAKVTIPCHFWMFAEHNGNPAQFLDAMKEYAPESAAMLMAQGECYVYRR